MGVCAQVQISLLSHCFCQGRKAVPIPSGIVNTLGKVKNLQEKSFIFLILLFAFSNGLQSAITDSLPMYQQQKLKFPNLYLMLETAQHQRIRWFQPHCDILYTRIKQTKKISFFFLSVIFVIISKNTILRTGIQHTLLHVEVVSLLAGGSTKQNFPVSQVSWYLPSRIYELEMA